MVGLEARLGGVDDVGLFIRRLALRLEGRDEGFGAAGIAANVFVGDLSMRYVGWDRWFCASGGILVREICERGFVFCWASGAGGSWAFALEEGYMFIGNGFWR